MSLTGSVVLEHVGDGSVLGSAFRVCVLDSITLVIASRQPVPKDMRTRSAQLMRHGRYALPHELSLVILTHFVSFRDQGQPVTLQG